MIKNESKIETRITIDNTKTLSYETTTSISPSTLTEDVSSTKSTLKHKQKVSVCELCSESVYCKDNKIFDGVSCQAIGVENKCGQYSMEIYLAKEFAIKLNVKLSDIYINEYDDESDDADVFRYEANSICKSSLFNKTHIKFNIPYDSCGTKNEKIVILVKALNLYF